MISSESTGIQTQPPNPLHCCYSLAHLWLSCVFAVRSLPSLRAHCAWYLIVWLIGLRCGKHEKQSLLEHFHQLLERVHGALARPSHRNALHCL